MSFKKPFKPTFKSPTKGLDVELGGGASSLSPPSPSIPSPSSAPLSSSLTRVDPKAARAAREESLQQSMDFANELELQIFGAIQDGATEKATSFALGKTVTAAIGVAAIPVTAAAVFEIAAPGVQAWLKGGWKGSSGIGTPSVLGVIPYPAGGTVGARYQIDGNILYDSGPGSSDFRINALGPISNIKAPVKGGGDYQYVTCQGNSPSQTYLSTTVFNVYGVNTFTLRNVTITKLDAPSDPATTIGYAPPAYVTSPRSPDRPPYYPLPPLPSQLTRPPSLPFGTSPLPPLPSSAPAPSLSGWDTIADWPVPSPGSYSQPEEITKPAPITYSSPPRNPVPPFSEADGCNPCSLKIGKKLEELEEKLEEKKKNEEESETPTCETYTFEYTIGSCKDGQFETEAKTLILAEKPTPALRKQFDDMLVQAAQACGGDCIASIPDWWQVRIGADRAQVVVAFRKSDSRTYHQIAIPHPVHTEKWTENLLGNYTKGPWSGVLTLKDNSKFIINCETKAEAQRMVAKAKTLINPSMQLNPSAEQYTERQGNAVGIDQMRGRQASYFSTGQRDTKPNWVAKFP